MSYFLDQVYSVINNQKAFNLKHCDPAQPLLYVLTLLNLAVLSVCPNPLSLILQAFILSGPVGCGRKSLSTGLIMVLYCVSHTCCRLLDSRVNIIHVILQICFQSVCVSATFSAGSTAAADNHLLQSVETLHYLFDNSKCTHINHRYV